MHDPESWYEGVVRTCDVAAARLARLARMASWARLLLAGVAVAALVAGDAAGPYAWLAAAAGVLFVVAVRVHGRWSDRLQRARRRADAARAGLARRARRWSEVPPWRPAPLPDAVTTAVAHDLGVVGERSLARLLDVTHPALGGRRVLAWLLGDPAPAAVVRARQASVAHLRARPELLLGVVADARHGGRPTPPASLDAFAAWCRSAGAARPRSLVPSVVAVAIAAVLVLAVATGDRAVMALAGPLLLVQLGLAARARATLQRELRGVDGVLMQLGGVVGVLAAVTRDAPAPGRFGEVQARLRDEGAVPALLALSRLLEWNAVRDSPMLHWALNGAVGYDVHLSAALAHWRARRAGRAEAWLDDAADAEALVALATLGFEHPGWPMPAIVDDPAAPTLDARGLAHPLLDPATVVGNDLTLAARGDAVVVSGSNMAGKTTFLRAVGLDVMLAQAGGPVCAATMAVRPVRVRTSVRVEDDLGRGVSLFLAEVARLRDVVHDAEGGEGGGVGGPRVLFLLDEVLHGTNAPDRRAATRLVLRRLLGAGAVGLVTTHDPRIGDAAPDAGTNGPAPRHLHFADEVERAPDGSLQMRFDYRARPGPAQRTNALAILEMLGLGQPHDGRAP